MIVSVADAPLVPRWSSGLDEAAQRIAAVVVRTEPAAPTALATIAHQATHDAFVAARQDLATSASLVGLAGRAVGDAARVSLALAWLVALVWTIVAAAAAGRRSSCKLAPRPAAHRCSRRSSSSSA